MPDFKSNETSSNSDSSTGSTAFETSKTSEATSGVAVASETSSKAYRVRLSNKESLIQLIPPYVRDICKNPKYTELRVNHDAPTGQTTYTYSITWDGPVEEHQMVQDLITAKSTTSVSNLTGGVVPPVDAKCDGPCRRMFKSNLLNSIGRCGHYLCNACYGIVTNEDGTNGCSSLHCCWKGGSREETKKFYEKEICRKQRERAEDMKSRGIDVKPASAANSLTNLSNKLSEMSCSESILSTLASTGPPDEIKQKCRLVILEASDKGAMHYKFSSKSLPSTDKFLSVITKLIERKKLDAKALLARGTLYYAQDTTDLERELHLIKPRDFDELFLYHFPKIDGEVVFVMDFNDFVKNGREVYFW